MQAELDNLMLQVKNAEEKARKAVVDAGTTYTHTTTYYIKKTSAAFRERMNE